jgi:hypothetical protein
MMISHIHSIWHFIPPYWGDRTWLYANCVGVASFKSCDIQVTSESDVRSALEVAKEKYGGVTAAVNCAGIGIAMRTLSKKGPHPLDQFQVSITHANSMHTKCSPFPYIPSYHLLCCAESDQCQCCGHVQCDSVGV